MRNLSFFARVVPVLIATQACAATNTVPLPNGWNSPTLAAMQVANAETTCSNARTPEKSYLTATADFDGDGGPDYARILKNNNPVLKDGETEYALFITRKINGTWVHDHPTVDAFEISDDIMMPACQGIRTETLGIKGGNLSGIVVWQLGNITLQGGIDPTYIYWDLTTHSFKNTHELVTP